MAKKRGQQLPDAPPQSEKAHQTPPPKELEGRTQLPPDRRGEAGQFTGEGAPGLQKK